MTVYCDCGEKYDASDNSKRVHFDIEEDAGVQIKIDMVVCHGFRGGSLKRIPDIGFVQPRIPLCPECW